MLISPPPSETGKTVGKPGCPRSSILPTQPPTGLSRHLPSAEPSLTQSLHSWAWVSRGSSFFVIWFSVLLWGTPGDGETTSLQSRKLLQPSHFQIQTFYFSLVPSSIPLVTPLGSFPTPCLVHIFPSSSFSFSFSYLKPNQSPEPG